MTNRRQVLAQVQVAMMLLTRLPAGNLTAGNLTGPIPKLRDAAWAFSLVGLGVGVISALGLLLALWLGVPPAVAAGLALSVGILVTGGLHEDGLADLADGFGGGQTRARKLEIMRDSRIGSYGTLALILSIGLRWQALAAIASDSWVLAACALIAAATLSRAGLPAMMVVLPAARDDGLGQQAAGGDWTGAGIAATIGLVAAVILLGPVTGFLAICSAAIACMALGGLAQRQIGGQTGDVLGAAQQVSEIAIWTVLAGVILS